MFSLEVFFEDCSSAHTSATVTHPNTRELLSAICSIQTDFKILPLIDWGLEN
jgi:hypothetical protein